MTKIVSSKLCFWRFYLQTGALLVRVWKTNSYLHTLQLLETNFYVIKHAVMRNTFMTSNEIHQLNSMAAEHFWGFGFNEGMNKKIRKHQSFKEYWNEGKYWLSDYLIGLQYLVHARDKYIRSVFHYLSQSSDF